MNTSTISFRSHKNLKSWLDYAGNAFKPGELPRLIITKAAVEEASESKASRLLGGFLGGKGKREAVGVGNTAVYTVRLPSPMAELVRECATRRGQSTSEWCAEVLMSWWQAFRELYNKENGAATSAWLRHHAAEYRVVVAQKVAVYAQKTGKALV